MKKLIPFLIAAILLLFSACFSDPSGNNGNNNVNNSNNNGNNGSNNNITKDPALQDIVISNTEYDSITISKPTLTEDSGTADSITAYIGLTAVISIDGNTVINAIESGIDVLSSGYTFSSLSLNTEYTIIVIAENTAGLAVKEKTVTTNNIPETTTAVLCNYESKYVHQGATITFTNKYTAGGDIWVGSSTNADSDIADVSNWQQTSTFTFDTLGIKKIFAKVVYMGADVEPTFSFTYEVVGNYPNYSDEGIRLTFDGDSITEVYDVGNDSVISIPAWADGYVSPVSYGLDVDESWKTPENALGQATGSNMDIMCLGNHGSIILTFSSGISDGTGYDFVVFENAFESGSPGSGEMFAELAYIEVSSDGTNFIKFDTVSRTDAPVGGYGTINLGDVYGLAGMHPNAYGECYGTPFDLNWLKNKRKVIEGIVDLDNIQYVRITDISGTDVEVDTSDPLDGIPEYYPVYDSFGNVIIDAYKTFGSGGFDLEAVGVINTAD